MATYTIAAGTIAAHDKQLVANTADSVTIVDAAQLVEVTSDGASAIYVTTDGTVPAVSGARCYKIPSGSASSITIRLANETSGLVVQLISAAAPVYSVAIAS